MSIDAHYLTPLGSFFIYGTKKRCSADVEVRGVRRTVVKSEPESVARSYFATLCLAQADFVNGDACVSRKRCRTEANDRRKEHRGREMS